MRLAFGLTYRHHLYPFILPATLQHQKNQQTIERDEADQPTQPIWNSRGSGSCYGYKNLVLTCRAIHGNIKLPWPLHSDLRRTLHAIWGVGVWADAAMHRCRVQTFTG